LVESNKAKSVICVTGPTASGKSNFAIALAKRIGGEVINADSVQVYRGFDIGSGKTTLDEMQGVPHHLLSHLNPNEQYSTGRFRKEAFEVIEDILARKKVPIVVGGTGLYIRSLFSDFMGVVNSEFPEQIFEKLRFDLSENQFKNWCAKFLETVDSEAYARIGENDSVRIQRALSLFLSLGVKNSLCRLILNRNDCNLSGLIFILEEEREVLNSKINSRVQKMWEEGWVEEVRNIIEKNSKMEISQFPALRSIGYKHIFSALSQDKSLKTIDLSSLINSVQRDTRRFAKRQRTWWRHQPEGMGWFPLQFPEEYALLESTNVRISGDESIKSSFSENLDLVSDVSEKFMELGINGLLDNLSSCGLSESDKSEINVIFKRIFLKIN
jgi:tRNA dimethylallyltransferase